MRATVLLVALLVSGANAEEPVIPGDDLLYCTVCHGVQLMGNEVLQAPRLSGMEEWYVKRQLIAFKEGWRGVHKDDVTGKEMQPMAAALDVNQVVAATKFVAATSSPAPASTISGDAKPGADFYLTCAACHGENGEGNEELGGPALTTLNDWYMVTQLQNYRDGVRGSHSEDMFGQQMKAAAAILPDDQAILDVIAYIATLE